MARRSPWPSRIIVVLLILSGAIVTAWPIGETAVNSTAAAERTSGYVAEIEAVKAAAEPAAADGAAAEPLAAELELAHAYNTSLTPDQLKDPWSSEGAIADASRDEYLDALSLTDAIGRLRVPAINVDLPIFHDAEDASLNRGVGHMYGSSLPVGGEGTHSVLAAHTGMRAHSFFDRLPELTVGETFTIDVAGETLHYVVDQTNLVRPDELTQVEAIPGEDHVTLVTCITPPGGRRNELRLLVRGTRTEAPAEAAADGQAPASGTAIVGADSATVAPDFSIQAWMWPRIAITAGALILLAAIIASWIRTDRRTAHAHAPRRGASPEGLQQ